MAFLKPSCFTLDSTIVLYDSYDHNLYNIGSQNKQHSQKGNQHYKTIKKKTVKFNSYS